MIISVESHGWGGRARDSVSDGPSLFPCVSSVGRWDGTGYEKYNSMRADPALCFLERVGMPDAKAIAAEQRGTDMLADGGDG